MSEKQLIVTDIEPDIKPDIEPDCLICFCPIEKNETIYSCASQFCSSTTCQDCTESLIIYSEGEGLLPKCPSKDCKSYYILSGMNGLSAKAIHTYQKACLSYFLKDRGEEVKKKIQQEKILEKLRQERKQFIQSTFPEAVALVADITFSSKLRRLEKQKSILVQHKVNNANRTCMNVTCNGFLDKDFICMTCQTIFCRHCEKSLKAGHLCQDADIESLKFISDLVKCPKCKLPVIKASGCDSITCSHCQTNFLYSTGKEGGHGSTNAKINLDIKSKIRLSTIFRELVSTEVLQLLLQIELFEPAELTQDVILTPLKNYLKDDEKNDQVIGKQLAKKIDQYMQNKYQRQIYFQYVTQIEEFIKAEGKDCDADFFHKIVSNFERVLSQKKTQKLSKNSAVLQVKQI